MKEGLYGSFKESSQRWLSWTKQHARELSDAALRHVERQDLLSERQKLLMRAGEVVVQRLVNEGKKSVSSSQPELAEIFQRLQEVQHRLDELASDDRANPQSPVPAPPEGE